MKHVFLDNIAVAAAVTSLWDELTAHKQDKPADTRTRIPVGFAAGSKPKRRRWQVPTEPTGTGLGKLDRAFAKSALGALAREEIHRTAGEIEDALIEEIDTLRARQADLDAHLTDLDVEAQEAQQAENRSFARHLCSRAA